MVQKKLAVLTGWPYYWGGFEFHEYEGRNDKYTVQHIRIS